MKYSAVENDPQIGLPDYPSRSLAARRGSALFMWLPICPADACALAPGRVCCDLLARANSHIETFSYGEPLCVSHLVVKQGLAAILDLALDEICAL